MKRPIHAFLAILIGGIAVSSYGTEANAKRCGVDDPSLVRLDALAKEQSSSGVVARSALKYLAEKKHTTSGYFISSSPTVRAGNRIVYYMYHESGFTKHCEAGFRGNRSGLDGVLEVEPSTQEVKSFLYSQ